MKKTKLLSILLVIVMLLSTLSIGASALQNNVISEGSLYARNTVLEKQYNAVKDNLLRKSQQINPAATSYRYYNQLNETQKSIYSSLLTSDGLLGNDSSAYFVNATYDVIGDIYYAMAAFFEDYPEYYWLLYAPVYYYYSAYGSGYTIEMSLDYSAIPYYGETDLRNEYNSTVNAVKSFSVSGSTRYEQVKSIHDSLCYIATYADLSVPQSDKIFFPSSCLLYPYNTVCDGYAKAFKLICDKMNIPCIIVTGYGAAGGEIEGHTWNYVQMEDGKWYAVDVTWDDNIYDGGYIEGMYDYFLVGENTYDSWNDTFGEIHIAVGDRFTYTNDYNQRIDVCLSYPYLNANAYDPNNVQPQPQPQPTPDAKLGDVNGDGKVSVVDAKWILQAVAGVRVLNATQNAAADINADGKISVVDAKRVLQAVAGIRNIDGTYNLKMYAEYQKAVPDLGALYGISCAKKDTYNDGAVEYWYNNGDINNAKPVMLYADALAQYGFYYDHYLDNLNKEDHTYYEYYFNTDLGIGVTLCLDYNGYYGMSSVYIYYYK